LKVLAVGISIFYYFLLNNAAPENIHTHPMGGHWKFLGGGALRSQKFERNVFKVKLEFPWGWVRGPSKLTCAIHTASLWILFKVVCHFKLLE